jgi:ribose transport system substrate-binding protein
MRRTVGRCSLHGAFAVLALLGTSVLLVACGSSGSGGSYTKAASAKAVDPAIPESGCGAVPRPLPDDPDGVLASLPAQYKKQYAGYVPTVHKSPWGNFKPKHGPPYKVTLSFAQVTGPTQLGMYEGMKKAFDSNPDIKFSAVTTGSQLNIPQQLQQFGSQLDSKPDIMIVEPLTDAFGPLTDKAAKQGIPVISIQGTTDSKNAVNVQSNSYGIGAVASSATFRQMGGKGNVLYVHGISSSSVDQDATAAFRAGLKNCPGIKLAGEIAGAFVSATVKAETLKFLATHPGPIDAVVQLGGTPGVISAFEQAGRPIPLVVDRGGFKGSLGYWINNKDKFHNLGLGWPPEAYGKTIADFTAKMLAGDGIKISDTTAYYANITAKNLSQWADPKWNLNTPGVSEGPPNAFMPPDYINGLFNR